MVERISHDFKDEEMDSKVRWFKSLTLEERMELFVAFTNLILDNNPDIVKQKNVRSPSERVRIISKE